MNISRILKLIIVVFLIEFLFVLIFNNFIFDSTLSNVVFLAFGFLGSSIGILIGALIYHRIYEDDLDGFKPKEIAMLYSENKSIIEQLSEGIISIDKEYNITTINKQSKLMFNIDESQLGSKVYDVFPYIDFQPVIKNRKQRYNRLLEVNNDTLLVSYFPLYSKNEVIGASAIFRSRLEIDMLLDQISGYQKISKALREQKHEFQNKLHVILGLIKLKDYETVQNYISENVYTTNLTSDYYSSRIFDDKISALFVGKEIQSFEYGVKIALSSDSNLTKKHHPINSDDLIIVVGNLIDNSLEAYGNQDIDNKTINISIIETETEIIVKVKDNAGGIDNRVIDTMFNRGVSTKPGGNRGTGLSLVKQIVELYNGSRKVETDNDSTIIEIRLGKVKL